MYKKTVINLTLHVIIVVGSYFILFNLKIFNLLPDNTNLLNWDASFHHSIMAEGYQYIAFTGCNLAFFPLFPMIWKLIGLSPMGISIFNSLIFLAGLSWLLRKEQISSVMQLLLISIPSFIFFALPYSESIFFLFTTMVIIGYRNNNQLLRNIGFLGASVVKSASIVLMPAIIICEFMSARERKFNERLSHSMIWSALSSFAGLLIAACIQGMQTGKWFYFLEMQQYWGRHWILPELPLYSPIAYDAISFMMGVIAIYLSAKYFYGAMISLQASVRMLFPDKAVIFSLLYLSATTVLDTFFTYNNGGANIWSINRHFLCTPFVIVMIIWLVRDFSPSKTEWILMLLLTLSGIYFTRIYQSPLYLLSYVLFFTTLTVLKMDKGYAKYLIIIYLFNAFIQLQYYHGFLSGNWIG